MDWRLAYGADRTLRLDLPQESVVNANGTKPPSPVNDPAGAVIESLGRPIDLPPIAQALVPGDRVTVAIDAGVPQVADVVAGVLSTLLDADVAPDDMVMVAADHDDLSEIREGVAQRSPALAERIQIIGHDPDDRNKLSYLAASQDDASPIYLNRHIIDADVVLPVGCQRVDDSLGYMGATGGLFPAFADINAQDRFMAPSSADWPALRERRRRESQEAAWLLGVQYVVQIVPGPSASVLHAVTGTADAVSERGRALCEAAWRTNVDRQPSLVVACIDGGQRQQTWENVGRALFASSQVVDDDGAILLCTTLERQPGAAVRCLATHGGPDEAGHDIRRHHTPEAVSALIISQVLQRCRVYLVSNLEEEEVSDLGIAPVEDVDDISRLCQRHGSCLLLPSAQYAMPGTGTG